MTLALVKFKWNMYRGAALYALMGMCLFGLMMLAAFRSFGEENIVGIMQGAGNLMQGLVGGGPHMMFDLRAFLAMSWRHPLTLFVLVFLTVSLGLRFLAHEYSDKTIDLLFTRPVSRRSLLYADLMVAIALFFLVSSAFSFFLWIAARLMSLNPPSPLDFASAALLTFSLMLAILSLTYFIGALVKSSRQAMGVVVGVVGAMYMLDVLSAFWETVERVHFLSLFKYFTPLDALTGNSARVISHVTILGGFALIAFAASQIVTERADL